MSLILPEARDDAPSSPEFILAFVRDHIPHADIAGICRVEGRLHDRLRILREREQPCDLIRDALVLCANRRRELTCPAEQPRLGGSEAVDLRTV